VAAEYLAGGLVGGLVGMALATSLAPRKAALKSRFRQPRLHRRGLHALPQRCGAGPMIAKPFRGIREKW